MAPNDAYNDYGDEARLWCYREGTALTAGLKQSDEDWSQDIVTGCRCRMDWHGRDCGQPEVIWRALMAAKAPPFDLLQPGVETPPHRLVYMLEGDFVSLDLLELQLRTIEAAVDFYLIYSTRSLAHPQEQRALRRRLRDILGQRGNYYVHDCRASLDKCTAAQAYRSFRRHVDKTEKRLRLRPSDLLLYTNERVLVSLRPLKFLKYYAADVRGVVRLRLKSNVYGFYWQHPEQTYLSGLISSFRHVDDPRTGNANPAQLLMSPAGLIVGDLNHFGGWHCRHCQHPEEIIASLHAEQHRPPATGNALIRFPNATRTHQIDAVYLQKLIANGIAMDGQTQLQRVRHNVGRYFAPRYAVESSWKYGHLLVNLYASLDESIADDDENIDEVVYQGR